MALLHILRMIGPIVILAQFQLVMIPVWLSGLPFPAKIESNYRLGNNVKRKGCLYPQDPKPNDLRSDLNLSPIPGVSGILHLPVKVHTSWSRSSIIPYAFSPLSIRGNIPYLAHPLHWHDCDQTAFWCLTRRR